MSSYLYGEVSTAEIRTVARAVVTTLAANNLSCCLVGGAACSLYGTTRRPNDVDMVVLSSWQDTETIKALLVAGDSRFFLVRSTNPRNTYRVLWFRLSPSPSSSSSSSSFSLYRTPHYQRKCKVDILTPGIMNIPDIPSTQIKQINNLPVAPILTVLFLKLQGWTDHLASTRSDLVLKTGSDSEDIKKLVMILKGGRYDLNREIRRARRWLPSSFIEAGKLRAGRFMRMYGLERDEAWSAIRAFSTS